MPRDATITQEQVNAAADAIQASGQKPTTRNVREALGSGSMATVLKFLQVWQGSQVRQSRAIDDTLDPEVARVINNMLARRIQESTAEVNTRLAEL